MLINRTHGHCVKNKKKHGHSCACRYPLPAKKGELAPVVIHMYAPDGHTGSTKMSVRWAALAEPLPANSTPPVVPIPASALTPGLPAVEIQRRTLQDGLKVGWSLWSYNMLGVVRLPDSSVLTTAICQLSTQQCLEATHIEDTHASIRVGLFANDASYWQYYVGFQGINVSLSFSGGTDALTGLIEPQGCEDPKVNCSDYALVGSARFAWGRRGAVQAAPSTGELTYSPLGLADRVIAFTSPNDATLPLPKAVVSGQTFIAVPLSSAVGFQESVAAAATDATAPPPTIATIRATIAAARAKEYATYSKFGELAEVAEAVQASVMWNWIYNPAEYGPLLPVSRSWDFVKYAVSEDWGYVVFDWDNYVSDPYALLGAGFVLPQSGGCHLCKLWSGGGSNARLCV